MTGWAQSCRSPGRDAKRTWIRHENPRRTFRGFGRPYPWPNWPIRSSDNAQSLLLAQEGLALNWLVGQFFNHHMFANGGLVRFVLVEHPTRGRLILMCSDLMLDAHEIIRLYELRFKIELGIK